MALKNLIKVILLSVLVTHAHVSVSKANSEEAQYLCFSDDPTLEVINACTNAIQSGDFEEIDLTMLYLNRADHFRKSGSFEQAIADYTEVLRVYPNFDQAILSRGISYEKSGKRDAAINDYNLAYEKGVLPKRMEVRLRQLGLLRGYDKKFQLLPESVKIESNGCVASLWASGYVPKTLIDRGVNAHISGEINPSQISTKLMVAVVRGNLKTVEQLLEQGVDVDEKSPKLGCTALVWAILFKHQALFNRLLVAGADIELSDAAGRTPLMIASSSGSLLIVKRLINEGADVNKKQSGGINEVDQTALMYGATRKDNVAILKYLAEKSAGLNMVDEHGNTALMVAASGGHIENVRYLLSSGANRGLKNNVGQTAYDQAVQFGGTDVVDFLKH